jgi:uridine kinase
MNLTEALTDLFASPGPHLLAIDGPAGGGKSTLAKDLFLYFSTTRGVNLLGLDDIYDGWENALGQELTDNLERVAKAHQNQSVVSIDVYNWATSNFSEVREINAKEILILEGVGSSQEIIRAHNAITIWMDIDPTLGMERVLERDGYHIAEQMKVWQLLQSKHFAHSGARENADFIITTA